MRESEKREDFNDLHRRKSQIHKRHREREKISVRARKWVFYLCTDSHLLFFIVVVN